MHMADALSRVQLPEADDSIEIDVDIVQQLAISRARMDELRYVTAKDGILSVLKQTVLDGWPNDKKELQQIISPYFDMRDEISTEDGMLFRGSGVIVRVSMRRDFKKLHASHLGTNTCIARAKKCVFWPDITAELKDFISKCDVCRTFDQNQSKEPMILQTPPEKPWEKIALDLFHYENREYYIFADYFNNFFDIDYLPSPTTQAVTTKVKTYFARYGIPQVILPDNGPQCGISEFRVFARTWDFEHRFSSPYHSKEMGKKKQPSSKQTCY